MRSRSLALGASVLAALTFSATVPVLGQTPRPPDRSASAPALPLLKATAGETEIARTLERLVPRLMRDGDVPGLSIAIVRDGRVLWHRAFGVKDANTGAAVNDETIFEAASLSKPVFAYAVAKLVDEGKLQLDWPLTKILPGDYVEDPRLPSITVRRVLSHTTGFPNWRPDGQPLRIHFTPGERFSYSGEGFVYLQKAVERETGQTLDALTRRLVFEPLGMRSSRYVWEERFGDLKATGHDEWGSPQKLSRPAEANAAASLQTTALDYARFLAAVLDGSGLSPKIRAEMLRPQIHVDEGCENCVAKKPTGRLSSEIAWGLGWGLQETSDGLSVWHWGDNGSGFQCYAVGYPKQRLGTVIFTNGLDGHGIIPDVVEAAIGGRHPAFAWLAYERYDSPARSLFKDVLARGAPAIASYRDRRRDDPSAALAEPQANRIGYWLLGRKRVKEAIVIFEMNVADFPSSWNAYDSLGEAYAADGQSRRAIESYQKSVALNPENTNGVEALRKLKSRNPQD